MIKKIFLFAGFLVLLTGIYAQQKPDALKHFFNGRDLDVKGRTADAVTEYNTAIEICRDELKLNPQNMDSYAVYSWSLFRLKQYAETLALCQQALGIHEDARIIETMGEALFYLNRFDECLAQMQRYISMAPNGDRISVAYFFEGEIYRLRNQYEKAEIAYTTAVFFEPRMSLWWFRLGTMREALKDINGAVDGYKRALQLWPDYTEAQNALKRLNSH